MKYYEKFYNSRLPFHHFQKTSGTNEHMETQLILFELKVSPLNQRLTSIIIDVVVVTTSR